MKNSRHKKNKEFFPSFFFLTLLLNMKTFCACFILLFLLALPIQSQEIKSISIPNELKTQLHAPSLILNEEEVLSPRFQKGSTLSFQYSSLGISQTKYGVNYFSVKKKNIRYAFPLSLSFTSFGNAAPSFQGVQPLGSKMYHLQQSVLMEFGEKGNFQLEFSVGGSFFDRSQ